MSLPLPSQKRGNAVHFLVVFSGPPLLRGVLKGLRLRSAQIIFFVETHSLADICPIFSWFSLGVLKILKHSKHSFETFNKPLTFFYLADQVFLGIA